MAFTLSYYILPEEVPDMFEDLKIEDGVVVTASPDAVLVPGDKILKLDGVSVEQTHWDTTGFTHEVSEAMRRNTERQEVGLLLGVTRPCFKSLEEARQQLKQVGDKAEMPPEQFSKFTFAAFNQPLRSDVTPFLHGYQNSELWDAIKALTGQAIQREIVDSDKRTALAHDRGHTHSTQNLFVHDKKSKNAFLVSYLPGTRPDLVKLAPMLKAKELRMCSAKHRAEHLANIEELGCCVTAASLFYDSDMKVQWVVEKALLDTCKGEDRWEICAGCHDFGNQDHHNAVTLTHAQLEKLIPKHWDSMKVIPEMPQKK